MPLEGKPLKMNLSQVDCWGIGKIFCSVKCVLGVFLLGGVLTGCSCTGSAAVSKQYYEKTVLVGACSANDEIYTMNPGGSDQQQITSGGIAIPIWPKWSGYLMK